VSAPPGAGPRADVVVLGGGLAGLTLAMHLRREMPGIDVLVLERQRHPAPPAAHKVGESTVEIAADYFSRVLGLKPHLEAEQIKKFGFRFFASEGRRDIDATSEIGASRFLSVPSWQLDRGTFETFLGEEARRRGVRFEDGSVVRSFDLTDGSAPHRVDYTDAAGAARTVEAPWLVDASGRAGLVKRKRGLAEGNAHAGHAVWFRLGTRLPVDAWSDDPAWKARCEPRARWQSTNHFCGAGYWVWLIPLASGSHSVGIVADPALHPLETMNTFERALDWLAKHQPRLHDEIAPRAGTLQDFAFFRRFSYGCRQVFSSERWALTGEAGLFLDPFYSPGSDFIAIANTYIVDLIARDRSGRPFAPHAPLWDSIFHSFYESTLALYTDQYFIFGDPEVLPVKVLWDYTYYWGVLAPFFFQRRLTDLRAFSELKPELEYGRALNVAVQETLRAWAASRPSASVPNPAQMLDQASLPWFADLNASLLDTFDDAAFRARIRTSTRLLRTLAREIVERADAAMASAASARLHALLGDRRFGDARDAVDGPLLFAPAPEALAAA
jgi:flavin-dependent dehydrogenase